MQKMFGKIQDLMSDKEALICVLIDEVGGEDYTCRVECATNECTTHCRWRA